MAKRSWGDLRGAWAAVTLYGRFEVVVAIVLRVVISAVIVVALYRLVVGVLTTLVFQSLNPLEHGIFQTVFGEIMTLLIALEFNHTLRYTVARPRGIVEARTVILIALLALARKAIVTEPTAYPPGAIVALAALTLSLGMTYWLMREPRERPRDET
ncbi:MAG TPA: phosphate-starvation-inducible PsiE family protein [Gemmatimonadales bacterium]|nr:phosphate-starvation-inducible PsiE family protein [Gemmatimonadales bacterium]